MEFAWDGTGDGGTNIPNGLYEYLVTATEATAPAQSPGGGGGEGPPSPMMAALAGGETSYFVEPPPMPPVKKDGKWYSWEEINGPLPPLEMKISEARQQQFLNSLETAVSTQNLGGPMAPQQGSSAVTKGPTKPPTVGVKNKLGTFGAAFQRYLPNGMSVPAPTSGLPFPLPARIRLEGAPVNASFTVPALPVLDQMRAYFAKGMWDRGWQIEYFSFDDNLSAYHLRKESLGGSNAFNKVNLGLFMAHGTYGTTLDYTDSAGQTLQTYFPFYHKQNNTYDWLRLSECDLGSTNLFWMGLFACNSLEHGAFQSMYNSGRLPINNNLHILLGISSTAYATADYGQIWARKMKTMPIGAAWIDAAKDAYKAAGTNITGVITFRYAGWGNCFFDTLKNNQAPDTSGGISYVDEQVFP